MAASNVVSIFFWRGLHEDLGGCLDPKSVDGVDAFSMCQ